MRRGLFLTVGLVLLLAVVSLYGCGSGSPAVQVSTGSQSEGLWVTGQGKVTVVPDLATLSLGIAAQAASVAAAQSQAGGAMEKVMMSLTSNGVAKKDIQTKYFSIQQVTKWDPDKKENVVVGYHVTNTVTAKMRNLDKVGSIIDAVALAGGDLTRIQGISFSVDDPSAYYKEAREKAMADAKAKAEQMAKLAGVTLGKPTYISESGATLPSPVVRMAEGVSAAATTPISPGEMEISLTVQVTYAIR